MIVSIQSRNLSLRQTGSASLLWSQAVNFASKPFGPFTVELELLNRCGMDNVVRREIPCGNDVTKGLYMDKYGK